MQGKEKEMTKKRGFSILVLVFGLVLMGCPTEEEPGGGPDSPPPTSFTDVQLYTLSGTTFAAYSGNNSIQTVAGFMEMNSSRSDSIGPIGSISVDGKLTLNLPDSVADAYLYDFSPADGEVKGGALVTSPALSLRRSDGVALLTGYFNKAGSVTPNGQLIPFTKGWNYFINGFYPVTDLSAYKWVIVEEE
jgi:hypothetical protein